MASNTMALEICVKRYIVFSQSTIDRETALSCAPLACD